MPAKTGFRNRIKLRFLKGYRRNGVSARKGIDTVSEFFNNFINIYYRNGVPAREGIDTWSSLIRFSFGATLCRNGAPARKGIDTLYFLHLLLEFIVPVEMEY